LLGSFGKMNRQGNLLGDFALVLVTILWIGLVIFFIATTGFRLFTHLVLIFGIFIGCTFSLVSYLLIKNRISAGIWVTLATISFLITVDQFNYEFIKNAALHNLLVGIMLISLMFIALMRLWNVMMTEG